MLVLLPPPPPPQKQQKHQNHILVPGYFSPYSNPELDDGPPGESLPLRLAAETARFISDQAPAVLAGTGRFFAFLAFYSVHAPLQTTERLWRKYRGKGAVAAATNATAGSRFVWDRRLPVRIVQDHPM